MSMRSRNSDSESFVDPDEQGWKTLKKYIIRGVIGLAALILVLVIFANFAYVLKRVRPEQIGIRFRSSAIYEVVGPGVYSDLALFPSIQTIDLTGMSFTASDQEVITIDKQRLGLEVTGTVHRPGMDRIDFIIENWSDYRTFYIDDDALIGITRDGQLVQEGLMQRLSRQAMKVCIGDRTFDQSVIGSSRDDLRSCIELELSKLVANFGLEVKNVVIPNIVISPEVQAKLDAITSARLAVEQAKQDTLKAIEEANRAVAEKQGVIRVTSGEAQEKAKQDAITAGLQKTALEAEMKVIEAKKANDLFAAQKDLEIQKATNLAAQEAAKAKTAEQLALAIMYQQNPSYVAYLQALAYSNGFKTTDKVFFLQEGFDPTLIFGNQTLPTIDVTK